jgi:uncharacterized protein YbjT (DUF2867 family)
MTSAVPTILAIGAVGEFAGLVVPALAGRGARVRGLVRDAAQGDAARARGAAEIAIGDLRDRASVDAALRGVDAVFYIAPAFMADEAEVGTVVVNAARRAGVRRVVFSSVIHPILGALVNHAAKAPVEEAIVESGMEYAFLHPALFMQNLAGSWPTVVESGVFAEPWSAETRFSRVDYRDVAEVAALALTEDRLTYGTYELCAEGHLNRHDVAALMGEALGWEIAAGTLDPDKPAGDAPRGGASPPPPLRAMFAWYDRHGLLGNALTLRAILGREPRTLRAYIEELAAAPRPAR